MPIKDEEIVASFKDVWKLTDIDESLHQELQENEPCLYEIIKGVETSHSKKMFSYLIYMAMRLIEMQRILKPTGSIYLHCDPTASHYLKIVMDCIFGSNNFRNEIVWHYRRWTAVSRGFQKLHDIVLFYTKSKEYTFNQLYTPYTKGSADRKEQGVLHRFKKGEKPVLVSNQSKNEKGVAENDVWQIPFIAPSAKERVGYPTQKPLKLLEKIIKASSNEGDLVLDPFCGCSTALVAAEQLNRKWVGIDASPFAKYFVKHRMEKDLEKDVKTIFLNEVSGRTDMHDDKERLNDWEQKKKMYDEQQERCNGCEHIYHIKDLTVDHKIPTSKGGQDTPDNKQLLCFHCNVIKSTDSMKTLKYKLRKAGILEPHE